MSRTPKYMDYKRVSELFTYDEVNGGVIRKAGWWLGKHPSPETSGYIIISVCRAADDRDRPSDSGQQRDRYKEHRLVYLLNNPDMDQSLDIDHINHITHDNRIENLRLVTSQENAFNKKVWGVHFNQRQQMWRSAIRVRDKYIYLGRWDNVIDARAAYLRAKKIYHVIEER